MAGGVCAVMPVFGLGPPLSHCLVSLVLSCSFSVLCVATSTIVCGGVCYEWRSVLLCCELCLAILFSSPFLRVRCHSSVGLVWCVCVRFVLLWNSGDGSWCGRRAVVCGLVACLLFLFLFLLFFFLCRWCSG
nr:MAG TPA: hypothetical protein [Caudoviricetes sp.]